jgi:N-acetyl sugar amidotransferase
LKYCTVCITPHSRPNISFDENGHCNCARKSDKDAIDWVEREKLFRSVVAHATDSSKGYDCVVPVSGGKDSTWQIVKCLEYGLKPLAITWKTPARTAIGQRNLDNLVSLGVDHIDYQISPAVEKKFVYRALERFGSTAIPMHLALFAIPLTIAVKFRIPLVIWGENSAFEYGGDEDARRGFCLDSAWLRKHGVTQGTTAEDWVGADLTRKELTPYFGPSDAELESAGVRAIFLGYYFRWDPHETFRVAREHGFQANESGARTGFYEFADIDDDFISIHHWLKWYKFGFTRTFDNLSLEIRHGRLTRDEALQLLRQRGDETPHDDIKRLCDWLDISVDHFYEVIEKFRNRDVWVRKNGTWMIEDFILPDYPWSKTS